MKIGCITFDCADPAKVARFWAGVFTFPADQVQTDEGNAWAYWSAKDTGGPTFFCQRVPEPKTAKNRCHLDLSTADREGEVARLITLGATVRRTISENGNTWTTMHDPEQNEFCVVSEGAGG